MFSAYIISYAILILIQNSHGAIWDCNNRYEHKTPQGSEGATWCANEGGSCSGPGRVYYGEHLTWTYVDYLADGETIDCNNGAFGCDPLWGTRKKCYIDRYRCLDDACKYKQTQYLEYDTLYVAIDFSTISILKTNGDSESSTDVQEEWIIPDGTNTISMNVDHIKYGAMEGMNTDWNIDNGCTVNINNDDGSGVQLETESGGHCNPAAPVTSSGTYGFQTCYIPSYPTTVVTRDVFEAGLKYTFKFQVGDHDTDGGFDNGPIFDFTYTEPDHRNIWELFENGYIERYFTRTGSDGRKARLFLHYWVIPDYDDLPVYFCN